MKEVKEVKELTEEKKTVKEMTRLPRGILPPGIECPPGTNIMDFCRQLAESGADFADQFDRNSATYHDGLTTPVPLGGTKVPEGMGGPDAVNWSALPIAPLAIDEDFGPDYNKAMEAHSRLGQCKKAISVVNKPVETAMRCRVQYKGCEGDDKSAFLSRLKGVETERDGALEAACIIIAGMSDDDVSERTRSCVESVKEQGSFAFEDKETFGEYMQVLQRANQAIFMDQKKLLARIKEIKKTVKAGYNVSAPPTAVSTQAGCSESGPPVAAAQAA